MKSNIDRFREELEACIRQRTSIVFIETFDHSSVADEFYTLLEDKDLQENFAYIAEWSAGFCKNRFSGNLRQAEIISLKDELQKFIKDTQSEILVLKNVLFFLQEDPVIQSLLQTFVFKNQEIPQDKRNILIILEATYNLPVELNRLFCRLTFPFPDQEDIRRELRSNKYKLAKRLLGNSIKFQECVNALIRMQMYEVKTLLTRTMEQKGLIKSRDIHEFSNYKKQIVRNSGVLEVVDSHISKDDIGDWRIYWNI
ncbi:MAG: hypothetical protein LUD15_06935 [Bacteroides sp.]|nr:hypothetical protein [Bacteroides sp.]